MSGQRDIRSFVSGREPSIDRMHRPRPEPGQRRQERLFDEIGEEEDFELDLYNSADNSENSNATNNNGSENEPGCEGALVYLRFRPVKEESVFSSRGNTLIVGPSSENISTSNHKNTMEKQYVFTDIFNRDIAQYSVYENCVRLKIETEESFTLLTYGTSGSGKTYTLLGTETQPGIMPRALEQIFSMYKKKIYPTPSIKLLNGRIVMIEDRNLSPDMELRKCLLKDCVSNSAMENTRNIVCREHNFDGIAERDISVFVWISFVEIYNENVYDLLEPPTTQTMMAPPARRNLKIVGNDGNVFVKGLTSVYVKNSAEALHLLNFGLQRVQYAATSINMNSSRSHCIFTIDVLMFDRDSSYSHISYRFCDLAGSERLDKTGNVGSRLKEAQRINTSLLVLGRCLDAANNSTRKNTKDLIPYRESKLTMLLQSALLGKEKLLMIVNVMPANKYYEENINVLSFASIAKNIVFKPPVASKFLKSRFSFLSEFSQEKSGREEVQFNQLESLLEENIFLRSELNRLNDALESCKAELNREMQMREQNLRDKLTKQHQDILERQKKTFEKRLNMELASERRLHQQEINDLRNELQWQIDDLNEELLNVKENNKKSSVSSSKARKSIESPTEQNEIEPLCIQSEQTKRRAADPPCEFAHENVKRPNHESPNAS